MGIRGFAPTLIPDWKRLWLKLWSVRLALLAALLSAAEVALSVWIEGKPAIFAGVAFLFSVSAAVARIVAQPELQK